MSDEREKRTSDVPADLGREREAFVRQFLRKGFEVTEEVLSENRELRDQVQQLRDENARFRAQIASDDAIRDLIRRIDTLEVERNALLTRSGELEMETERSALRSQEVEQELHDLANLYIASSHLHSTLSVRGVVRHLSELLQQLMGADRYAIFLCDREGATARPLLSTNLSDLPVIEAGKGVIGEALTSKAARITEKAPVGPGTLEHPIAVVPMLVRDTCVGAIVVVSLLAQKDRWAAVDHELFALMGAQAGIALIAALQWASSAEGSSTDPRHALAGIEEHLTRGSDAATRTDSRGIDG